MEYAIIYGKLHAEKGSRFAGFSLIPHAEMIAQLVKKHGSKTLLDFGCGKGYQYFDKNIHATWGGIMPTLYDPAVPDFAKKPHRKFDGVICTDVMEHIELGDMSTTLRDVFRYSRHWVFFSISTRPSKKEFPDGRNLHVTVKSPKWWDAKLEKAAKGRPFSVAYV